MTISSEKEIEKFRKVSARNREQGEKYEDFVNRRLGLKKQAGSGCGHIEKEDHVGQDSRGKDIMVQSKSTSGKAVIIKVEDLERLVKHAADCNREPVFIVGIVNQLFSGPKDWVLVPLEEWEKYGR